jgi:diguanylate cyclase (GGDEF)-like protein
MEQVVVLLLVALVAVVVNAAFVLAIWRRPPLDGRLRNVGTMTGERGRNIPPENAGVPLLGAEPTTRRTLDPADLAIQVATGAGELPEARAGVSGAVYDRVIRLVSLSFIAVVALVVLLSGSYGQTAPAIYVVLAIAFFFVLIVHDFRPGAVLGGGMLVVEGCVAIALVTILVGLTGGVDSPFFFGYYLIVAAAALFMRGATAFLVAALISVVYLALVVALPGFDRLEIDRLLRLAFYVLSLWLLAYLASIVAAEQRRTRDEALRLSLFDPLTRLHNRNYFAAVLEREIERAGRTGRRFCVLMIDMDELKPINDTFGHHYGDQILRAVADVIRRSIRAIDSAARYGGDEFVVLLPETDPTGAFVVAEKLRQTVSEIRLNANGRVMRTTVSVGIVSYPDDGTTSEQLMMTADAAMYESKHRGRNLVVGPSVRSRTRGATRKGEAVEVSGGPTAGPEGVRMGAGAGVPESRRAPVLPTAEARPRKPTARPRSAAARQPEESEEDGSSGRPPGAGEADESGAPRPPRRFQIVQHDDDERMNRMIGSLFRDVSGRASSPRPVTRYRGSGTDERLG